MTQTSEARGTWLAARARALAERYLAENDLVERSQTMSERYDRWSPGYDTRNRPENYFSPALLGDLAAQHLVPGDGPILDLACGTGLLGEQLCDRGFNDLVGSDISERMLDRSRAKSIYHTLVRADLHHPLPFDPGMFSAVTCMGAFFEGIVEVVALAHILPVIRPGGHLICDIEMLAWEKGGYRDVLEGLAAEGMVQIVAHKPAQLFSPDYLKLQGEERDLPQAVLVAVQVH